ncbi:MAG: tRNA 2-thiouridine(34) synthase MnmA [Bacteroidales bacterium]
MTKKRVLVAMSGGVDSSVAAILLAKEGYELVGVTMKVWDYTGSGIKGKETGCCSLDSINDARKIAIGMGFPHYVIDLRDIFREKIINNFVDEYMKGRTPNPCVLCNSFVKWEALLRKADQLGCSHIATGHYARVRQEGGRHILSRGVDMLKDQSYVLWGVSQENLGRTLLPLGGFTKGRIREIAREHGFETIAEKSESYEICFVPDNDYRGFLKRSVEGVEEKLSGGDIVDTSGKVLGKHKGYPFYTIGQRKGLDVALGSPAYVSKIDPESNTVTLGFREDILSTHMSVKGVVMGKYSEVPSGGLKATGKVRYHDKGAPCTITPFGAETLLVAFDHPVSAITPGQSAVFYEGDDVVAGGIIA